MHYGVLLYAHKVKYGWNLEKNTTMVVPIATERDGNMNLIRSVFGIKMSCIYLVTLMVFFLLSIAVPKRAMALDAQDCIRHVERHDVDGIRYWRITRANRKECDLYMIAKNFPQLGDDGKPVPMHQQLISIKAANDAVMQGKPGLRAVHSKCVPNSKPWPDQTKEERLMCADEFVNYYPVSTTLLVPLKPQLSVVERVGKVSEEACNELAAKPNPSEETKKVLRECQKLYSSIVIPAQSVSPEQLKLDQALAEKTVLQDELKELQSGYAVQKAAIVNLENENSQAKGIAIVAMLAFALSTVLALAGWRRQKRLRDLANIVRHEMEARVNDELKKRAGGPTSEEHDAVLEQLMETQGRLQKAVSERIEISQELAGKSQQYERKLSALQSEIDSANEQIALLGGKRDELANSLAAERRRLEEEKSLRQTLTSECGAWQQKYDALTAQLTKLWQVEQGVRGEHLKNLQNSIELAKQVIAKIDERYRLCVAEKREQDAEKAKQRLDALHEILEVATAEFNAVSVLQSLIYANSPAENPINFAIALEKDVLSRRSGNLYALNTNLALERFGNELSGDNQEALEQLAQLRAENSQLHALWIGLVTGAARALGIELKEFEDMDPELQAEKIALKIGEFKSDYAQVETLERELKENRAQNDDLRAHNASLREAMEGDHTRQAIAAYEYTAMTAEVEKAEMGRRIDRARAELKTVQNAKERLEEALKKHDGSGALALEAPELAVLPVKRLMYLVQQCILALEAAPGAKQEAEYVISSEADLLALNGFLHLPLVSDNGYKLPPSMTSTLGPLMVSHTAGLERPKRLTEPMGLRSTVRTLPPPQSLHEKHTGTRKRTLQGMQAPGPVLPPPAKVPVFEEDEDKKSSVH